jgi:hypothetical protein
MSFSTSSGSNNDNGTSSNISRVSRWRMMVPQSQPNLYGALNIATNCSHGNSCVVDASFIKMQALPPRK